MFSWDDFWKGMQWGNLTFLPPASIAAALHGLGWLAAAFGLIWIASFGMWRLERAKHADTKASR